MIELPPKSFLDTQIVINVAKGNIPFSDWKLVSAYLRQTTRYCISALTFTELLWALAKADEKYFDQHKRRFQVLLETNDAPECFDFIPYFVAKELGLEIIRPAHLEKDFLAQAQLICAAPSKSSLLSGFPDPANNNQITKVRLDRFKSEFEQGRTAYLTHMENLRSARGFRVGRRDWILAMLAFYNVRPRDNDVSVIFENFSATYEFEMSVRNLVKNPNFRISDNSSDYVDGQQLVYLCNPETIFVTNDSDFRNRTKNSAQAGRIKTFDDLLDCARRGVCVAGAPGTRC